MAFQGDRHFTYDQRGNLTKEARGKDGKLVTSFTYDAQNQLVEVNNNGIKTQYQYDALGRRTKKSNQHTQTEFLWNGDVLLSEGQRLKTVEKEELTAVKIYVFEPYSFKPLAQIQNNEIYHYHLDHLGTPQELTANDGSIVWSARYKTYGNLALKDVDYVENNLRFQGQYFDQETGLHYNRHRYYNPNTGQFTQQDPIGLLGGLNNYQYAPNPVGWVDPFGLTAKCETSKPLEDPVTENKAIEAAKRVDDPDRVSFEQLPDDTTELPKGEKGNWNKELNKELKSNHKYKVGDHLYETDEHGRVKRVSGELDLNTRDRNTYQQGKSAEESGIKDGLSDDDGGHLIASIFDGAGEQINYSPMNSNLNRGAWKRMENKWADALKEGKEVKVDVRPIYEGDSKRPSKFIARYTIDGEPFKSIFKNKPGG